MPIKLVRNDITKLFCDAIVKDDNSALLGGEGLNGRTERSKETGLPPEYRKPGKCEIGEAKVTNECGIPFKYVIHTVGPKRRGSTEEKEKLLRSCYRSSLAVAKDLDIQSIAFPLISSGIKGFPKELVLKIAVDEITAFLLKNEMLVYVVIHDKSSFRISKKLFDAIASFIDEKYEENSFQFNFTGKGIQKEYRQNTQESSLFETETVIGETHVFPSVQATRITLDEALNRIDESFSEMLLRKIDEKGITDVEC